MTIEITTLKNGLRVMTDTVTAVDSVALGVWCGVGTRHEDMSVNGVAHMVEHMLFKGTEKRTTLEIVAEIEDAGGNINAYTSRDITAYHIHTLKDHAALSVEILGDILQNSTLLTEEVEKERAVIIQEIGMAADTPDDIIFDDYQSTAYPGQALGAPILGSPEIIANMQRQSLAGYIDKHYAPSNLVLSASGNISHDDMVRLAELHFNAPARPAQTEQVAADYQGGEIRSEKPLEQSHVALGFPSISRHDPRYYSAIALSTILGGGMSSRLFQEIREKRGLVYSVFSFHSAYDDAGQFVFYAGTGPGRLKEYVPALCGEITKIRESRVTDEELKRAKTQMRSGLLMARESMMTRAGQQAKHQIHFGHTLDIQKLLQAIDAVSRDSILSLAQEIFATKPTLAALGPLQNMPGYDSVIEQLK